MSTDHTKTARVQWIGKQQFVAVGPSGHAVALDSDRDSNTAPGPMEFLLLALGACTATDIVIILEKTAKASVPRSHLLWRTRSRSSAGLDQTQPSLPTPRPARRIRRQTGYSTQRGKILLGFRHTQKNRRADLELRDSSTHGLVRITIVPLAIFLRSALGSALECGCPAAALLFASTGFS